MAVRPLSHMPGRRTAADRGGPRRTAAAAWRRRDDCGEHLLTLPCNAYTHVWAHMAMRIPLLMFNTTTLTDTTTTAPLTDIIKIKCITTAKIMLWLCLASTCTTFTAAVAYMAPAFYFAYLYY